MTTQLEKIIDLPSLSYLSPKVETRHLGNGYYGNFASQPIQKEELIVIWSGIIVNNQQLNQLPQIYQQHSIQVEEAHYLVSSRADEPADYINHSCEPNAGLVGQIMLVALRDIAIGEEICYDYATSDGSPYDEFTCLCGTPSCRKKITGEDWRRPELQQRYAGHFSPYLQRRIDQLLSKSIPNNK
ncbi:MAG: hypothetical protein Kow0080_25300 [Candidatus Promineifilaceae bacterium]